MVELVDTLVLGTSGASRESSSLSIRTKFLINIYARTHYALGRKLDWTWCGPQR